MSTTTNTVVLEPAAQQFADATANPPYLFDLGPEPAIPLKVMRNCLGQNFRDWTVSRMGQFLHLRVRHRGTCVLPGARSQTA